MQLRQIATFQPEARHSVGQELRSNYNYSQLRLEKEAK